MSASFSDLTVRLTAFAETVANARIAELKLARHDPAARWRKASLLWPQFTKG